MVGMIRRRLGRKNQEGREALGARNMGVNEARANAPARSQLPRSNKQCPSCHETEAVFFQSQQRSAETGMVRRPSRSRISIAASFRNIISRSIFDNSADLVYECRNSSTCAAVAERYFNNRGGWVGLGLDSRGVLHRAWRLLVRW